jgi:hypothetical protein
MSYVTGLHYLNIPLLCLKGEDLTHPCCGSQKNMTVTDKGREFVALKRVCHCGRAIQAIIAWKLSSNTLF